MKLSARNMVKGTIEQLQKGQTTAHVRIDTGGTVIAASFTHEAVDDLKLKKGQAAYAVIKASDVMVAVDQMRMLSGSDMFATGPAKTRPLRFGSRQKPPARQRLRPSRSSCPSATAQGPRA
jgi:molybdopterin-binding protein